MAAQVEVRQPADPKWRERKYQLFHETREEYIKSLLQNISDCKAMIKQWDNLGVSKPNFSETLSETIRSERQCLLDYQAELRKVVQHG